MCCQQDPLDDSCLDCPVHWQNIIGPFVDVLCHLQPAEESLAYLLKLIHIEHGCAHMRTQMTEVASVLCRLRHPYAHQPVQQPAFLCLASARFRRPKSFMTWILLYAFTPRWRLRRLPVAGSSGSRMTRLRPLEPNEKVVGLHTCGLGRSYWTARCLCLLPSPHGGLSAGPPGGCCAAPSAPI